MKSRRKDYIYPSTNQQLLLSRQLSQAEDMPGVAKWSTPDNLETLRGKVRLRPLSCSPLLIKSSCNTEATTTSRRKIFQVLTCTLSWILHV